MRYHLEGVDHGLDVCLDGFMGKFGAGQSTHTFQSQVAQVSLSVLQELAQLVTGSHQQVWLTAEQKAKLTSRIAWWLVSAELLFLRISPTALQISYLDHTAWSPHHLLKHEVSIQTDLTTL